MTRFFTTKKFSAGIVLTLALSLLPARAGDDFYGIQYPDPVSAPVVVLVDRSGSAAYRGEIWNDPVPAYRFPSGDADTLLSFRRDARITLGGEVNLDALYRRRDPTPAPGFDDGRLHLHEYQATTANLRFAVTPAEGVRLHLKLDLGEGRDRADKDLLEECRFAFENIQCTGLSLIFGKGEVPFGQDRTVGILQSYHHDADRVRSSEGPIFILGDDEPDPRRAPPGGVGRPGEIDRVFLVQAAYDFNESLRIEAALFQNDPAVWGHRTSNGTFGGAAARIWWRPVEGWTVSASALWLPSRAAAGAVEAMAPGQGRDHAYATSLAFDGAGRHWEVFGEWAHGWDWGHADGTRTDTFQLGGAWRFDKGWRVGVMGEWLRRREPVADHAREDWRRLVASVQYRWESGLHLIAEYGHEWFRGRYDTRAETLKTRGDLIGLRLGWMF